MKPSLWNSEIQETLVRQAAAMASRIYPNLPEAKYACFYPMDRKRGEEVNWYLESMADRQRMMHLHGMIGRREAPTDNAFAHPTGPPVRSAAERHARNAGLSA